LVGILDFVFDEDKKEQEVLHEIKLKNQHGEVFYDKLTLIYLEMPNFNKTEDEIETNFDKWLYVLKNLPYLEAKPKKLQEKVFQKLFKTAEIAKFNREEVLQYEQSLKVYRDLKNVIDTAFDDGKAEGKLEAKYEQITKTVKRGKLTITEIAEDFEVEKDFVFQIQSELNL
jgi:PD-(D/E)XK nuclease family transposase